MGVALTTRSKLAGSIVFGLDAHRHDHRVDPGLLEVRVVDHRRLEGFGWIAQVSDEGSGAADHGSLPFGRCLQLDATSIRALPQSRPESRQVPVYIVIAKGHFAGRTELFLGAH